MSGKILAVTSGKGGVGKTFVSANLAAALAERGERVLVLDADLGLANLDVVLNLFPKVTLHEHTLAHARQRRGEVGRHEGLADATLAAGDGEDARAGRAVHGRGTGGGGSRAHSSSS